MGSPSKSAPAAASPMKQKSLLSFFTPPKPKDEPTEAAETQSPSQQSQSSSQQKKPLNLSKTSPRGALKPPASQSEASPMDEDQAGTTTLTAAKKDETRAQKDDDELGLKAFTQSKKRSRVIREDEEDKVGEGKNKKEAEAAKAEEEEEEEEEEPQPKKKKKKPSKNDDDDEYEAPESVGEEDEEYQEGDESNDDAPQNRTPKKQIRVLTPAGSASASKLMQFSSPSAKGKSPAKSPMKHMPESDRYDFLKEPKDAEGNKVGTPNYDPRTLFIPKSAWGTFKPFEKQYWEIKAKHFDTVVFFKKGFFYELYEMDADIGVKEFELNYSKSARAGEMKLAGFPISKLEDWAAKVLAKGYKVAIVDEHENSVAKAMREKKTGKKDKIIERTLSTVLTAGTLVYSTVLTDDMSNYCMSIKEVSGAHGKTAFGVVILDASTAEINFSLLEDDNDRTQFETLITQMKPREIVCEKGGLTPQTLRVLKNNLSAPIMNALVPEKEFWTFLRTSEELEGMKAFGTNEAGKPLRLQDVVSESLRPLVENPLVMSAFGGLIWYLRSLKIDQDMLSQKNFQEYHPVKQSLSLILDGQTLTNLEVFQNSLDGSEDGTLMQLLNHCVTPSGKRMFKRWLCHPLRRASDINERLDAVEDFLDAPQLQSNLLKKLHELPDLERIISRIHAKACKLPDFLKALEGFKAAMSLIKNLRAEFKGLKSARLNSLISGFPNLSLQLSHFDKAFDHQIAKTTGEIVPNAGAYPSFDAINKVVDQILKELQEHLEEQKKVLKCSTLKYKDVGGSAYQIEMSKATKVPKGYTLMSSTNTVQRYWTDFTKQKATELAEAQEQRNSVLGQVLEETFQKFNEHFSMWGKAVNILAELDCLAGLSISASNLGGISCRPEFVDDADKAVFEVEELRHPCILTQGGASNFIPNDIRLGGAEHANFILLTGPNMGGKSTLLRQTCVAIIMAQIGCFVPAKQCRLTPVDRIFTRIGAHDNIMAGHSTFMVELQETSRILQSATPHSLVILDELGRGTSTFDGYAIAYSVLHHLITHTRCLGLFSTHYHLLNEDFGDNVLLAKMHMACVMDEENKQVTFLYKLKEGVSEKSHGMNVAHMAGISAEVIARAGEMAQDFEQKHGVKRASLSNLTLARKDDFSFLCQPDRSGGQMASMRNIWQSLQANIKR